MVDQTCTHCHKPIVCNVSDIQTCACQQIKIADETIRFLKEKTAHDCLCNDCLRKYDEMMLFSKTNKFPKRPGDLVEGVHFYMENGFFVFTELYHFQKGRCCKNGCRHCVYGIHNENKK